MKKVLAVIGILLVVLLAAALVLRLVVFDVMQASGDDMWPGVGRSSWLLVNRLTQPRRGDLIVFRRAEGGAYLVRRVVGLPGETLGVVAGKPVVTPTKAEAKQEELRPIEILGHPMALVRESVGGRSWQILVDKTRARKDAPETAVNGYFVLADNRDHGADSRDFGVVPAERVRGVVTMALTKGEGPFEK